MPTMTVIHVKYLEKKSDAEEIDPESLSDVQITKNPKEVMVNIDCPIGLIIDYIKQVASIEGEIDLCEETTNQMKNVTKYPGSARGTEILVAGVVYFIIKIDRDPEGRITRVLPMVISSKADKIAADIMSKIYAPNSKRRSTSLASKKSQDKITGKNNHQDKKSKVGKPASRTREANGSKKKIV